MEEKKGQMRAEERDRRFEELQNQMMNEVENKPEEEPKPMVEEPKPEEKTPEKEKPKEDIKKDDNQNNENKDIFSTFGNIIIFLLLKHFNFKNNYIYLR